MVAKRDVHKKVKHNIHDNYKNTNILDIQLMRRKAEIDREI